MKTKLRSNYFAMTILPLIFGAALMGTSTESAAAPFCSHGQDVIVEGRLYLTATQLISADFDGDGKIDQFCKDLRKHSSNGNRLLEWLVLGNGTVSFSGVWNEWCTHKGSYIRARKRGNRHILVCVDDQGGYWERKLP